MSLNLFGYKNIREKVEQEKKWMQNNFADCPVRYDPEAAWRENAVICRLSLLAQYCETFGIYQILSREFNDSLAVEIKMLGLDSVLAVGAGGGELAAALRRRGIDPVAADDFSGPAPARLRPGDGLPEKMDYRAALDRFKPQLVICSWMPAGADWTVDFRATASVRAYMLIGVEEKMPGGDEPGWRSRVLKEPNKWSLCRLDLGVDFEKPDLWWRHSKVIICERI